MKGYLPVQLADALAIGTRTYIHTHPSSLSGRPLEERAIGRESNTALRYMTTRVVGGRGDHGLDIIHTQTLVSTSYISQHTHTHTRGRKDRAHTAKLQLRIFSFATHPQRELFFIIAILHLSGFLSLCSLLSD